MRIGIFTILAAIIATTAVAQDDDDASIWVQFDDMFLRNFWRAFFDVVYKPAVGVACTMFPSLLASQDMVIQTLVPIGLLGADEDAVIANLEAMESVTDLCTSTALKVWDQVWHINGKGTSMWTPASDFDYTPDPTA